MFKYRKYCFVYIYLFENNEKTLNIIIEATRQVFTRFIEISIPVAYLAFKYRRSRLSRLSSTMKSAASAPPASDAVGLFNCLDSIGRMWRARVFSLCEEKLHELCVWRTRQSSPINRVALKHTLSILHGAARLCGKIFTENAAYVRASTVKVRGRIAEKNNARSS